MAKRKKTKKSAHKTPEAKPQGFHQIEKKLPAGEKQTETPAVKKPEEKPQKSEKKPEKPAEQPEKKPAAQAPKQADQQPQTDPVHEKQKRIIGRLMMVLGVLFLTGAVLLYVMNRQESWEAGAASAEAMPQMQDLIRENVEAAEPTTVHVNPYDQQAVEESYEMTEEVINGYRYIGYLKAPAIELELPVLSDWSQRKLQIAPCRHMGSTKSDDLVIAAHNYPTHFGHLKELKQGDAVEFVDMDGILSSYQVVTVNVIAPTAIEEVQAEELDLVLYTCTYGGANRVMVGCQRVENP